MTTMPVPADHRDHDPLLVAAYAAGDASGAELDRATALVASCPECARLHRDLRAISSSLASAPAPARPRDFRLSPDRAADLARPSGWRRLLAPLAGARSVAGPLAASMAALGVAGLLLGGAVNLGLGGTASSTALLAPQEAASMAPSRAAAAPAAGAGATSDQAFSAGGAASQPSAAASAAAAEVASAGPSVAATAAPAAMPSLAAAPVPNASAGTASIAPDRSQPSDKSAVAGGLTPSAAPSTSPAEAVVAPTPAPAAAEPGVEQAAGPSPLVLGSAVLLLAGVVLGLLRLAARRLV